MAGIIKTTRGFLLWILANTLILGILFLLFNALPLPMIIPCTYPVAQNLALAIIVLWIFQAILIPKTWRARSKPALIVYPLLLLLLLWLGSYPFSPLGFSNGRIPVLRGFVITRSLRPPLAIASGEIVTIAGGSIIGIRSTMLPVDISCFWASANGGAFDDPRTCDTDYSAPPAGFDVLKVDIQPGCHLPNTLGEIKIDILP
jgi:hypothetical protein